MGSLRSPSGHPCEVSLGPTLAPGLKAWNWVVLRKAQEATAHGESGQTLKQSHDLEVLTEPRNSTFASSFT